jgi:hypothetical protein
MSPSFRDREDLSHTIFAGNVAKPSLVRYMEKLQKTYSHYVLIHKAVRKLSIRPVFSIPFHVKVLPSPDPASAFPFQSMVDFEGRVKSYLTGALLSYSKADGSSSDAGNAIDSFWQRIKSDLDAPKSLPRLLAAHCESTLLRHHLDLYLEDMASPSTEKRTPYAYFGISKLSCFQCALYFEAHRACALGPSFHTRRSHTEVFACAPPASTRSYDQTDEVIENEMAAQLKKIIGQLLSEELAKQRMSSVDSTGSGRHSPLEEFALRFHDEGTTIINLS